LLKIDQEMKTFIDDSLKRHLLDLSFSVPLLHSEESERFIIVVEHKSNKPKNAALPGSSPYYFITEPSLGRICRN